MENVLVPFQNSPVIGTEQLLSLVSHNSRSGRSKSFPVLRDVKVGKQRPWGGGGRQCTRRNQPHLRGFFTTTWLPSAPMSLSYSVTAEDSHTRMASVNTLESMERMVRHLQLRLSGSLTVS